MEREGWATKTVTFFKKTTVMRWQHQSVAAAEGKDSVLMYLQHLSGDGRSELLIIDLRFSGFNVFSIDVKNVVNTRMSMRCQLWFVHLVFCTVTNYTVICYPLWCSDIRVSQLQPYSLFQISAQFSVLCNSRGWLFERSEMISLTGIERLRSSWPHRPAGG